MTHICDLPLNMYCIYTVYFYKFPNIDWSQWIEGQPQSKYALKGMEMTQ